MKAPQAPKIEMRRAAEFESELLERARAWIPSWGLADGERDFGRALLQIAARFNSEVAERLGGAGEKMRCGFLDWLAVRGEAARPARMPVVFKLAGTAREPILAQHPVRMQADVRGSNVTFETETDVQLVPGNLVLIVGVDPTEDAFFLPPPGLSNLDPLEPLPTQWRLKSFAAPGAKMLQFDPGAGLKEDMLVDIQGKQYRITNPKDDLATIEPPVPPGDGFPIETLVTKVDAFSPFERARNQQDHVLYLGHTDLLNIEAEATIDVIGVQSLASGVTWEYWGKAKDAPAADADSRWRTLTLADASQQKSDALVLRKPNGAIDPHKVGTVESRWIRAHTAHLVGQQPSLMADEIMLRINATPANPAASATPDPVKLPPVEAIVNTTPSTTNDFYPLGREPRMFDSLYLGCAEAFSKKSAAVEVQFDLVEPSFGAMATIDAGSIGSVLAGVDKTGALHLFKINVDGTLGRLSGREPMVPPGQGVRLSSAGFRPVMWMEGSILLVAVAAGDQVWVWKEMWPLPFLSHWESLGSPLSNADPTSKVVGLVTINHHDAATNTDVMMLVALRDERLSMRASRSTSAWDPLDVILQANEFIETIAPVTSETVGIPPGMLLAVVNDTNTSTVYSVTSTGAIAPLLAGITKDVVPFGIERANLDLEVIAVKDSVPQKLWAWRTGPSISLGDLDPNLSISNTFIDGRIESGQIAAYCIANSATVPASPPDLLTWLPFDPEIGSVVFRTRSDPSIGSPSGGLAIFGQLAYVPGTNKGEVLAAQLTGTRSRWDTLATDYRSALAVRYPAPTIRTGDTIAPDVAGRPDPAIVTAAQPVDGRGAHANQRFIWLDRWLDRATASSPIPLYATSSAATFTGTVLTDVAPFTLQLHANDQLTAGNTWLLIDDGTGGSVRKIVQVTAAAAGVATIDLLPAAVNTVVSYWLPSTLIHGNIFPALQLGAANSNWDINDLDHGDIYFPALDPKRQHVVAVAVDSLQPSRPEWLAFESRWSLVPLPGGGIRLIVDGTLTGWIQLLSDTSSNPELSWEYWNGTGWWRLDIDQDQTDNLKNSGLVKFSVPADLTAVDWAGKTNHWIRARLIGGDYGRENVVVTSTTSGNTTTQTVDRSTDGLQPPYALNVWVRYSIDQAVMPAYLQTQDSNTLRNQSDANRTRGAQIEVFTPLIYALRRFEASAESASTTSEQCVPDCECSTGTASTSPANNTSRPETTPPAVATRSQTERRALYLGFSSKLSGEPVNVLLVVGEEHTHDKLAPMTVDALVGDHFVPVVAKDDTRAIGETGLISMSFSVDPIPVELFGQSLSWLRLTPGAGDGTTEWKPALRGAYLNAVWTRAAETMTRELVGSSEGAPNLTLQLARPPLLKDSLELRVKEPLGEEERAKLLEGAPDNVRSDEEDLPGHWVLWKQVADPGDYEPTARVYALDEGSGTIRFGDGQHGAIPPIGADVIVAFKYERTEPDASGGEAVPANAITARSQLNLVTPVESVEAAIAADQAAGGVAPESVERVLRFGAAKLRHRGRAVTARDFEDLALERFADVVQARCFVGAGRVRLIVVMRGPDPKPSQAQRRELRRVLLASASGSLAAPGAFRIEGPKVRRLRIQLRLRVTTLDLAGDLASHVKKTLQSYFSTDTDEKGRDGWPFGASPRGDDIAEALLDAPNLESIASIKLSEIDDNDSERLWPQTIKPSELAMLAEDGIRVDFEIVEAVE